jgi:hypothetical protein
VTALQVVCAVGASESDFSGPRRVDGDGATRLVEVGAPQAASQPLAAICCLVVA